METLITIMLIPLALTLGVGLLRVLFSPAFPLVLMVLGLLWAIASAG